MATSPVTDSGWEGIRGSRYAFGTGHGDPAPIEPSRTKARTMPMPRRSNRRPIHRIALAALATALVAVTGCSSQDPVGLRMTLEESGSGTLAVSALTVPEIASIEAHETEGVAWQEAARLMLTTGTFSDLDQVRFVDAEVDAAEFASGAGTLRIEFPCGDDARWFRALHVGASNRAPLRKALDNAISEVDLHENVTISIKVTNARVAAGLVQPIPRVSVTSKNDVATMVVPLEILESREGSMVLVVNWERTRPAAGG